jgi:D-alanyl-D-alanine carboxypeptidase (penicillin-binding protein 5/6)
MQAGPRRRRRPARVSFLRVAAALAVAAVLGAVAFAVWQVLPLTRTEQGVIPAAELTGVVPQTPSGGHAPPAFSAAGASSRPIPGVRVSSGLIVDAGSGRVLWMHRPHAERPIASLTKLMTALLAAHGGNPAARFTITPAMTGELGYTLGLQAGERVPVRDMLAGALIASANDAADALAVHTAGSVSRFVARMNRRAASMHLRDTRYSNPSGIIDAGNHSSAWDVAEVARAVLQQPALRRLVGSKSYRPAHGAPFVNGNRLLWTYAGAVGVKTGQTTLAGNCLAAAARRRGHTIIAVELNAGGDEFATASRMLSWGLRKAGS